MPYRKLDTTRLESLVKDFKTTRRELKQKLGNYVEAEIEEKRQIEKRAEPIVRALANKDPTTTPTSTVVAVKPTGPKTAKPTGGISKAQMVFNALGNFTLAKGTPAKPNTFEVHLTADKRVMLNEVELDAKSIITRQLFTFLKKSGDTHSVPISIPLLKLMAVPITNVMIFGQIGDYPVEALQQYVNILKFVETPKTAIGKSIKLKEIIKRLTPAPTTPTLPPLPPSPTPPSPSPPPPPPSPKPPSLSGTGVVMTRVGELIPRLNILLGSLRAGNKSTELLNELSAVLDQLLKHKLITKKIHKQISGLM